MSIFNEYAGGSKIVDIVSRFYAGGVTYRKNKQFVKVRITEIMHIDKYICIWRYAGAEYLNIIPSINIK